MQKKLFWKRLYMVLLGVGGTAIGCGALKFADLGIDPYNALVTGIGNLIGIHYGNLFIIVTGVFVVLILLLDKHYIGIATVFSFFFVGYIVQFTLDTLNYLLPNTNMILRIIALVLGLLIISVASSLYFTADLGVSAYDAMSLFAADKSPVPFRICRIISDISCVIIGFIFKATIGIGTVVTAFFLGPAIDFFNRHLSNPLLYGKNLFDTKND